MAINREGLIEMYLQHGLTQKEAEKEVDKYITEETKKEEQKK